MPRKKLKNRITRTYSFNKSELDMLIKRCHDEGMSISSRLDYLIKRDNWEAGEKA